jgi:predicted glycosyltransferase
LASAFQDSARVAIICGGQVPAALAVPTGVELFKILPVSMSVEGTMSADDTASSVESVMARRKAQLVDYAQAFEPDVLVVEMFPFRHRKFSVEIIALINAVRQRSPTKVLASVRDVLVSRPKNQAQYDQRAVGWLNQYFDAVLVHSDPHIVFLAETFSAYNEIKVPLHYTGYVTAAKLYSC